MKIIAVTRGLCTFMKKGIGQMFSLIVHGVADRNSAAVLNVKTFFPEYRKEIDDRKAKEKEKDERKNRFNWN